MNKLFLWTVCAVGIALAGCSLTGEQAADKKVALAKDGQALAKIVIAKDADKVARFAAADLKWHLDQITGGDFQIEEQGDDKFEVEVEKRGGGGQWRNQIPIYVGPCSRTKTQKKDYAFQEWGVDISKKAIELVGFDREDKGKMTFALTSYTTCHTCDRAGKVTLEK